MIHDYMGIDLEAVWEITQRDLPVLQKQLQAILRELDTLEEGHEANGHPRPVQNLASAGFTRW